MVTENEGSEDEYKTQCASWGQLPGEEEERKDEGAQAQERGVKVGAASFVVVHISLTAAL